MDSASAPRGSLKVIGAGCGRTGTASLKKALEMLGFDPCYHMFEVISRGHEARWEAAFARPDAADWAALTEGFKSAVDFPASLAYRELMAANPEAKVVLSVRDAKSWSASVRDTIWNGYGEELSWVAWPFRRTFQRMTALMRARFFGDKDGGVASGAVYDDKRLQECFNSWNAQVIATVPSERLLTFQAKDGWGPLCKFLGVPEPAEPFPNVNDTVQFKAMFRARWRQFAAIEASMLLVAVGGAVALMRRRK